MKRRDEVLVGILLTIAVAIGVMGTIWLLRGGFKSGYPLFAVFKWGANLRVGQPVRLAGVQVGFVEDVALRNNGTLLTRMNIEDEYRIPEGTTATVVPVGIFGDVEIALNPIGPNARSVPEGDTVPTGNAPPGLPEITAKADSVASVAIDVSRRLQTEMVDSGGLAELRRTIASTNVLVAQLTRVAAEQSRQLTETQVQLRRTLAAIDSASVDSTVRNFQVTSRNVAAMTDSLVTTTSKLNSTLARLDRGEGTAGKLLTDTLLYRDVRSLVTRLDSLTLDFKKNPRRYINLEIF
jgi:phospholipid/cholesterol/gamma-HCH transport system substrate-binding protein